MKKIIAILSVIIVLIITFILDNKFGNIPPIGKFLDPFHGFLALVDSDNYSDNEYVFPELKDEVKVKIDDDHIPHIFVKMNMIYFLLRDMKLHLIDFGKWNFRHMQPQVEFLKLLALKQ